MFQFPKLIYYKICRYLHPFDTFNWALTNKFIHGKLKNLLNAHQTIFCEDKNFHFGKQNVIFPIYYTGQYLEPCKYALYFLKLYVKSANKNALKLFWHIYESIDMDLRYIREKILGIATKSDDVELFTYFYNKRGIKFLKKTYKISLPNLKYLHKSGSLNPFKDIDFERPECEMFMLMLNLDNVENVKLENYIGDKKALSHLAVLFNNGILDYKCLSYDSYLWNYIDLTIILQNFNYEFIKKYADEFKCSVKNVKELKILIKHYDPEITPKHIQTYIKRDAIKLVKYALKKSKLKPAQIFLNRIISIKSIKMYKLFADYVFLKNCMYYEDLTKAYLSDSQITDEEFIDISGPTIYSKSKFRSIKYLVENSPKFREIFDKKFIHIYTSRLYAYWPIINEANKREIIREFTDNDYFGEKNVKFLAPKIDSKKLIKRFENSAKERYILFKYVREHDEIYEIIEKNKIDYLLYDQLVKYSKLHKIK